MHVPRLWLARNRRPWPCRQLGRWVMWGFLWVTSPAVVHGQASHEVLLLINRNSDDSVAIGHAYRSLRGIPHRNVVYLDLPDKVLRPRAECSMEDFHTDIWKPAQRLMEERGLGGQILAWVYSAGFPIRVKTSPPVSLLGATFVRGRLPKAELVEQGRYISPLFAGPVRAGGPFNPSASLHWHKARLREEMPLPSMMLGFTGARGNTRARVIDALRKGHASDATRPDGGVFFVQSDDVRSRIRHWQYESAAAELNALGVQASVVQEVPRGSTGVMGMMLGRPWFNPFVFRRETYLPGSMGEHLTSAAAYFHHYAQTKVSSWIRAGASGTAGTVTEPMAIWTKFPHARFFVHYARGCTMLESFYQSILSPLQILLLGDPLARPWAVPPEVHLKQLPSRPDAASTLRFEVETREDENEFMYTFLLDGAPERISPLPVLELDVGRMEDGRHDLRAVAHRRHRVHHQQFDELSFLVDGHGRGVSIQSVARDAVIDRYHPPEVSVSVRGPAPQYVELLSAGNRWTNHGASPVRSFAIPPASLGLGNSWFQAVAVYENDERVRSERVPVVVDELNRAPAVPEIDVQRVDDGFVLRPRSMDAEGDPMTFLWLDRIMPRDWERASGSGRGRMERISDGVRLIPEEELAVWPVKQGDHRRLEAYSAEVQTTLGEGEYILIKQAVGLVFGYRNPDFFNYFALSGDTSSWNIGTYRNGEHTVHAARGAYIRAEQWYHLMVREDPGGGVTGLVDGKVVCHWPGGRMGRGALGVWARHHPAKVRNAMAGPCFLNPRHVFQKGGDLIIRSGGVGQGRTVVCRASDGFATTGKEIALDAIGPGLVDEGEVRKGSR